MFVGVQDLCPGRWAGSPGGSCACTHAERMHWQVDAAHTAPAAGDADDLGDLGEVPMEWLEHPTAAAGPAAEEEDYD